MLASMRASTVFICQSPSVVIRLLLLASSHEQEIRYGHTEPILCTYPCIETVRRVHQGEPFGLRSSFFSSRHYTRNDSVPGKRFLFQSRTAIPSSLGSQSPRIEA